MRKFQFLCLMLCLLTGLARAQAPTLERLVVHLGTDGVPLHPVHLPGGQYVLADDSGLTQILALTNATFAWSADRQTLDIHMPGRDVHWDVAHNQGTVGTEALTLPDATVTQNGQVYLQVSSLCRWLGLTLVPIDATVGSYAVVSAIQSVEAAADGGIVVRANGPLLGTFEGTALRFEHVAWGLPSDDLTVGNVQIHVEQHGDGVAPTVLRVALAPGAKAVLAATADPNECRLDVVEGPIAVSSVNVAPTPEEPTAFTNVPPGSRLIVLDPGHGGSDPGCHCPWTGLTEKEVTLDMCLQLKAALEARGVRVLLTRYDDRDLTYPHSPDTQELGARAAVANRHHAALFVSVHCNASVSHALRGTSVHWFKHKDYRLASLLEDGLRSAALVPVHGLIHSNFYVLRHTWVPSVLVETAYLTNRADETLLGSEGFRKQMVEVLADSLAEYVGSLGNNSLGRAGRHATGYNRK